MSSQGNPFWLPLAPEDPNYTYGSLPWEPFRYKLDPTTGMAVPGSQGWAIPSSVRGAVNDLAMTVQGPEAVAQSKVDPSQIPQLAATMTRTLLGAGMGADSLVGEASPEVLGSFRGYHGTPYTFEPVEGNPLGKFENKAIGSGEGAQVYGWGHYVAGAKQTAQQYQDNLAGTAHDEFNRFIASNSALSDEGSYISPYSVKSALSQHPILSPLADDPQAVNAVHTILRAPLMDDTGRMTDASKSVSTPVAKAYSYLDTAVGKLPNPGSLYHVEIRPDESELLDWDAPFSKQSPKVQSALLDAGIPDKITQANSIESFRNLKSGSGIYHGLQTVFGNGDDSAALASEALHGAGVPGIKYLDQFSRAPTDPATYNAPMTDLQQHGLDLINRSGQGSRWESGDAPDYHARLIGNYTQTLQSTPEQYMSGGKAGVTRDIEALKSLDPTKLSGPPRTRNYVIFHPDDLKIVGRNGVEVPQALSPVDHDPFAQGGGQ